MKIKNQMKNIIIIDSYPNIKHSYLKDKFVKCYKYIDTKTGFEEVSQDLEINFPHGTAIGGIIAKNCNDEEITYHFFDIYAHDKKEMLSFIISALDYIDKHFSGGILNCSLGSIYYDADMEELVKQLAQKMLIISAFDNAGTISYPAAFDEVIGVDTSFRCTKKDDFVLVKNSMVDIRAKGGIQRVPWVNPDFTINQGSSFACAYVTAYIAKHYYGLSKIEVMKKMEDIAKYIYNFDIEASPIIKLSGKRIAIVPYNKEIQSAFNFSYLLPFDVVGFYDFKFSGNIGRKLSSFYDETIETVVQSVDKINFDNIDVLVIGHLEELSNLTHRDLKTELLEKCLQHHVEVLTFDSLRVDNYVDAFSERQVKLLSVEDLTPKCPKKFGKLFVFKTPILGIFGTSSKQGKFTLQLQLKDALKEKGYDAAFLGTEPTSSLFGFDTTYPIGYLGVENENPQMIFEHSNYLVSRLDKMDKDLIIVGSQSGTVPQAIYNMGQTTLTQLAFLQGTSPDAVILAVNFDDSLSYIRRSILTMESLSKCKVIGLALYPFYFKNGWGIISNLKEKAQEENCKLKKEELQKAFNLPVIISGNKCENKTLVNIIEKAFSGD